MRVDAGFPLGCVYPLVPLHETIGRAARRRSCRSGVSDRSLGGTSAQTRLSRAAGHLVDGLEGHLGLGSSLVYGWSWPRGFRRARSRVWLICHSVVLDLASCSILRRAHLYMEPSGGSSVGPCYGKATRMTWCCFRKKRFAWSYFRTSTSCPSPERTEPFFQRCGGTCRNFQRKLETNLKRTKF
jgi:hypothetical protein